MADAITRTINEEVVLFDYKESLTVFPDLYPCRISIVPDIRLLNVYLSLPFKKGPMSKLLIVNWHGIYKMAKLTRF
jgi:hypothetical protein